MTVPNRSATVPVTDQALSLAESTPSAMVSK